jgi:hypothetical protein
LPKRRKKKAQGTPDLNPFFEVNSDGTRKCKFCM